jgi:peptidoglycan/LPS O-acetylase OafA/YrhL
MACTLVGLPLIYRSIMVASTNPSWDEGVRKVVLLRLDAIGVGVLMAYFYQEGNLLRRSTRTAMALTGAGLLVVSIAFAVAAVSGRHVDLYFARTWLLLICPLGAALTLPFFAEVRHLPGQLMTHGVRHLAAISYSVYLCNLLIYQLIIRASWGSRQPPLVQAALFLGGVLLIASISYRMVERPFIRLYHRLDARGRPELAASTAPSLPA